MIQESARIRRAEDQDLDTLVEIRRRARDTYYRGVVPDELLDDPGRHTEFREACARSIRAADRAVFCADVDGGAVAFTSLGPPFEPVVGADPATVGQLVGLYVHPARWSMGIGTALHAEAVGFWRSRGISTARLEVWDRNRRARDFYARHGWLPDGFDRPGPQDSTFRRLVLTVP